MKKLLSLLLTLALFACMLPVAAAETITEPVVVDGGTTEKITGDVEVSGNGEIAVTAAGSGSEAVVTGSATSTGGVSIGAKAVDGGTVEVGGDAKAGDHGYGAYADKGTVTVFGNASAGMKDGEEKGVGVYCYGGAATITGSAEAGNNGRGLWVDNGSAAVGENVTAAGNGTGIDLRQNGLVSVGGSVSANVGAVIDTNNADGSGALVVEGTLSGAQWDIQIEGMAGVLPDIVVGTLGNGAEPNLMIATGSPVMFDDLIGAIRYIVNAQGMTVDADTYEDRLTGAVYDVAAEGDEITVKITVKKGYRASLDAGSYADEVVDNGDGTYTVTVRRGGDLNFKAFYEKIKQANKTYTAPTIRVTPEEETLTVSAASRTVKAIVTCSDMGYARKQFASVTFRVDGNAEDANYFTVTLSAEGRLEISLAEELLASLEPGAHTVEIRLANGETVLFEITVA